MAGLRTLGNLGRVCNAFITPPKAYSPPKMVGIAPVVVRVLRKTETMGISIALSLSLYISISISTSVFLPLSIYPSI